MNNVGSERASAWRDFADAAIRIGGYGSEARLRFRCAQTFRGVDVAGKQVLEIGAGVGVFSAYCAMMGASKVVALEPGADGSNVDSTMKLESMQAALASPRFQIDHRKIEEYAASQQQFDVVIAYNVINHFDEQQCRLLHESESARALYRGILQNVANVMRPGAILILADCSRENFWPLLGLGNPIARSIEWEKHQSPRVWAQILKPLGFVKLALSWYQYYPLRICGRLTANAAVSFFLNSHFTMRMVYRPTQNVERSRAS